MNERLKQFIDYLGISTRNFEQKISTSNGQIARFLTKGTTIQSDIMSKIFDVFPDLNPDWLLLGKGEMLRSEAQKTAPSSAEAEKIWKEILADKENKIEALIRENERLRLQLEHLKKKAASSSDETALV